MAENGPHWPVSSTAAVGLTTGAFKALEREPGIGRSEAMRRSMLAMIDASGATPACSPDAIEARRMSRNGVPGVKVNLMR